MRRARNAGSDRDDHRRPAKPAAVRTPHSVRTAPFLSFVLRFVSVSTVVDALCLDHFHARLADRALRDRLREHRIGNMLCPIHTQRTC